MSRPRWKLIVFRALARDKAQRYREADTMAAELRGLEMSYPVSLEARHPSLEGRGEERRPKDEGHSPPSFLSLPSEGRVASLKRDGIALPALPGFPPDLARH